MSLCSSKDVTETDSELHILPIIISHVGFSYKYCAAGFPSKVLRCCVYRNLGSSSLRAGNRLVYHITYFFAYDPEVDKSIGLVPTNFLNHSHLKPSLSSSITYCLKNPWQARSRNVVLLLKL